MNRTSIPAAVTTPAPASSAEPAEPLGALDVVFIVGPGVDLDNPAHARVAAVRARAFADWMDVLAGEQADDDTATAR